MRPHLILVSWPEKIHLPTLVRFERIYQPGKHKQKMTGSFWCVPRLTVKQWLVSVTHFKETEKAAVQKNMFFGHFAATADEKRRAKPLSQRLQVKPVSRDSCWHIHSGFDHTVAWVRQLWVWPGKHSLSLSGTHTSAGWPCYSCTACFKKYSHVVVFSWLWANPLSQIIIPVCRRKKCEMHSVLWKSPQALTKNLSFSVILPLWKKQFVSNISQVVINDIGCSQPCLLVLAVPHSSSWSLRFWYFAVHHFPPVSTITTTPNVVVVVVHVIGGTSMFSRGQRNWLLTSETTPAWLGSGKGLGEPRRRRLWRATALAKLGRGLSLRLLPLLSWWGHRLLLSPLAVRLRVSFVIKKHS